MIDIIIDTLLDALKLIPFLFLAFLIIELIEHKFSQKSQKMIAKSGRFGVFIGGLLGAIPQCGFSVLATNLYVTRIITMGTLISIYLSTSDEMIPILLSHSVPIMTIIKIVGLKVVIGIICGIIIDMLFHKHERQDFHMCDETHCECEKSLLKSSIVHTLKTISFIFIITFILNIALNYLDREILTKIFMTNNILAPLMGSLIGLIPNCAASIMITEFYLNGVISFGTMMSGLLTGSGVALLVLFRNNHNIKENMFILLSVYSMGSISGIIIDLIMRFI